MGSDSLLVVNADEFGRSPGVNRGVAAAHERGIVTSASLMVRWAAASEAAAYAGQYPELSLGLHVDLGEWMLREGGWQRSYEVVPPGDADAVQAEIERQLVAFRELTGHEPSHLDSYQDVHRKNPTVRKAMWEKARELGVPLRHYSPRVAFCGEFYGQLGDGTRWLAGISVEALLRIIAELSPGVTELSCHPGDGDDPGGMYVHERAKELQTLCDPRLRLALAEAGVQLGSYQTAAAWCGPSGLTRAQIQASIQLLLDNEQPAAAWEFVRPLDAALLGQRELVRVAHALRAAGDLVYSLEAFRRAAERHSGDDSLRHWLTVVGGEVEVLAGSWQAPAVRLGCMTPVPGRILHLVGKSQPYAQTGYTVRTHYATQAQREAGLEPHVVTLFGFPWDTGVEEAPTYEEIDGVPHHRLAPLNGLPTGLAERLNGSVRGVMDLVRRVRPAVLHAASDFRNALVALEVGRAFEIPVVYEVRGFWEETWLSKRQNPAVDREDYVWRREREREAVQRANRVVTLADVMKEELVSWGVAADAIIVVPNAVDAKLFVPTPRDPALAESLGLADGEAVLGYISTLVPYEGVRYLIEAAARLIGQGRRVRVLIVGDGEDRLALESRARGLGICDRVHFAGRVPHQDILRYYGLIDVFVVPRTADRVCHMVTPLKPYEAMATARAVVVSGVRALREMVQEGVTGCVFEPENAESLATVVEPLLDDPARREELGYAARTWVVRNRTWSENGKRYLELYRALGAV